MIDPQIALSYYGEPPYFRNKNTNMVEKLPIRIRLPDGSTRTDPSQWSQDPSLLELAGYELTELTQQDIEIKMPPPPTLDELKIQKNKELDGIWEQKVKSGWQTPQGWNLGLDISDVTLLTGAFLLLKESVGLGLGSSTTIIDTNGTSHEVSLPDLTMLMLAYGQHRSNLSQQYANLKNQISNATNKEELEEIILW